MGVIFNRKGTGLTDQGDPMTENELAMLLSSMQGSGPVSNMMKSLFSRLAVKNRASARADKTRSGVAGIGGGGGGPAGAMMRPQGGPRPGGNRGPGGGFSLGLGQGGGNEMAQLLAMMKQGGAGAGSPGGAATPPPFPQGQTPQGTSALAPPQVPPVPQSKTSSQGAPGMVGGVSSQTPGLQEVSVEESSQRSASVPSSRFSPDPAERVKKFYTITPQKIKTIQDMMLSQDPLLREVAQGWLKAIGSGPKPEDQYLKTATGPILDIYNQRWLIPPKGEKTEIEHLAPGANAVVITHADGTQTREVIHIAEGTDPQLVKGVSTDPTTGIETSTWINVDKNTNIGRPVLVNGKALGAGSNIAITGELPGSTVGKWADKAYETELNLKRMNHLKQYLPDIMRVQTFQGKALFALQDFMASLGIPQNDEYYRSVKGIGAAWDVTNRYIKLITGAQMSEREAKRLMRAIPNPKDNPEAYKAKFEAAMELSQITYDHWHEIYQRHIANGKTEDEAGQMAQDEIADDVARRIDELENYSPWKQ